MEDENFKLKKIIRKLEDQNFILKIKCATYEPLIKFLLSTNVWCDTLLSFIINDETLNKDALIAKEVIKYPSLVVSYIAEEINNYENKLETNKSKIYKVNKPEFDLKELSKKIIYIHDFAAKDLKKYKKPTFSENFAIEFDSLLKKHHIDLNLENFLKSIDASKFIFSLIKEVCIRLPFKIENFNYDLNSLENIKKYMHDQFSKFTVKILNDEYFYLEPNIIQNAIENEYTNETIEILKNADLYENLFKIKRDQLVFHSNYLDVELFDKFLKSFKDKTKLIDNELSFSKKNDLVRESILLANACLSIPNSNTSFDYWGRDPRKENWFLKLIVKHLVFSNYCSPELRESDVFDPIRLIVDRM